MARQKRRNRPPVVEGGESRRALALRRRAEQLLDERSGDWLPAEDTERLIHELQVHQIELELQNEELQRAQAELEASHRRYFELYDLAPVGYFILDEKGLVHEVNITGATLLGVDRSELKRGGLYRFVAEASVQEFHSCLQSAFKTPGRTRCELQFERKDGGRFFALMELMSAPAGAAERDGPIRATLTDITQRKEAEEALRRAQDELERRVRERTEDLAQSNVKLQAEVKRRRRVETGLRLHEEIVKNVAEGVVVIRVSDQTILYANPRFEAILGYGPGELNGKPVTVLNYEDEKHSAQQVAEEIIARLDEQGEASYEIKNVKKDGTPVWCTGHTSTIDHSRYGKVWISVHGDITERKQAEETLKQSEARFRGLAELLPQMVFEIDLTGRATFVNRKALEILGYTDEDLQRGIHIIDFVAPEERERAEEDIQRVTAGESLRGLEYRGRRKDGHDFPVLVYAVPILRDGNPIGVRGIVIDITERKQAEDALRESEQKLSTLIEHSPVGIYLVQDGRFVFANPKFAEIYGYSPEEVIGLDSLAFVHPDDLELVRSHQKARLAGKETPLEYDARALTNRGETIWVTRRNRLIKHKGKPAILGNIVDVTQHKLVAEELRRLPGRLFEAQENERKRIAQELHDSLASNLAAVKFDLETKKSLSGHGTLPLDNSISLLQGAIGDIRRIMTDLRPSTLDTFGLVETIKSHCSEFHNVYTSIQIENRVEVREEDIADPLKIVIYRILQEAMSNAARHSSADRLRISLRREDDAIALCVEDNGAGFDVQAARSKGRMGLIGMEERTHLNGGEFTVDSSPGKGTVIRAAWTGQVEKNLSNSTTGRRI
jgi:PAS domain S-box-containing protein